MTRAWQHVRLCCCGKSALLHILFRCTVEDLKTRNLFVKLRHNRMLKHDSVGGGSRHRGEDQGNQESDLRI